MDDQIVTEAVQAKPEAPQGEPTAETAKPAPTEAAVAPGEGALQGPQAFPTLDPSAVRLAFESGKYPYAHRMGRVAYEKEKALLQAELLKVQKWAQDSGQKFVILFEGRDAAGKGGTIKRFNEHLNPRFARVVALNKPTDEERGQWYFQRYIDHMPTKGEMVFYDRSWYNRAGVERVMGYCTQAQYTAFLQQAPRFERMLVDDGIVLLKYWLCVDQTEQEQRFAERHADPLKGWKLSPVDLEARSRYADYTRAREDMLAATHTVHAPWALVDCNDQRRGRLTLIRDLLDRLPDVPVDSRKPELPPLPGKLHHERYETIAPLPVYAPPGTSRVLHRKKPALGTP